MKQPKDILGRITAAVSIIILCMLFLIVYATFQYMNLYDQLRYTHGKAIDLPEELTAQPDKVLTLERIIRNDSVIIQFPNN